MKSLHYLVLFVLIASCSRTTESTQTTDTTSVPAPAAEVTPTTAPVLSEPTRGIITQSESNVLTEPSLEAGNVVSEPSVGQVVTILEQTPDLIVEPNERSSACDEFGYHYFRVSFEEQGQTTEGWLYGKYLHILQPERTKSLQWVNFMRGQFEIHLAVSDGIGPSNVDGLTGCEDALVVVIRSVETDRYYLVNGDPARFGSYTGLMGTTSGGFLKLVASSEGGSTTLTQWQDGDCDRMPAIQLIVEESFQDGGTTSQVCIALDTDIESFSVTGATNLTGAEDQ